MDVGPLEEQQRARRRTGRWRRGLKKHRIALFVLGVYLVVFFFPSLFMGRIVSPNDVYRHYGPWITQEDFVAQNPVIHDPPLAYMPIAAMMKRAPESFHWNPWLASGIPGWGSAASAILTPFVFLPSLLPLPFFYTGMIVLKLLFAYWVSYQWLREERLGKAGAAIGALVGSACGSMFALWLWQSTNATALYPALLWAIARMAHGKKNSLFLLSLMGIGFLLSGYPAAILFGLWFALFYSIVQFVRCRAVPLREIGRGLLAVLIALMVAAPVLDPFLSFLGRTGYLEWRADMSRYSLPPALLAGLWDADHLGSITEGLWTGDPSLGPLNNPVELTIWFGPIAILLALLGLADRRSRGRALAWLCFGVVITLTMVGIIHSQWILDLPGVRYSPTTRLRTLLPPTVAFLAAGGTRWLGSLLHGRFRTVARTGLMLLAAGLALQYARTAASFYPYLPFDETRIETTESLERLRVVDEPFRVAPTFFWMMPNSSQMFGVEDIRSQWSSEEAYREVIRRIDPVAGQGGSVLLLNGLTMNVEDPFLKLLNVKYVVEPPAIDILRWRIEDGMERKGLPEEFVPLEAGDRASVMLSVSEGLVAVELTAEPGESGTPDGRLVVEAIRPETGEPITVVSRTREQLVRERKIFVPVNEALPGEMLIIRVTVLEGEFRLGQSGGEPYFRKSSSSLALIDSDPGARLFEILGTLPRYRATWEIVEIGVIQLLKTPEFDFTHRTAISTPDPQLAALGEVPEENRRVQFRILQYGPDRQVIETESRVPFLFTASEKLTPELRVVVDGDEIEPLRINGLFVGIPLEEGTHRVVLERRIGRGWWWVSLFGVVGLLWSGVHRGIGRLVPKRLYR